MHFENEPNKINYFLPGMSQQNDKRPGTEVMQQLQRCV